MTCHIGTVGKFVVVSVVAFEPGLAYGILHHHVAPCLAISGVAVIEESIALKGSASRCPHHRTVKQVGYVCMGIIPAVGCIDGCL